MISIVQFGSGAALRQAIKIEELLATGATLGLSREETKEVIDYYLAVWSNFGWAFETMVPYIRAAIIGRSMGDPWKREFE